MSARTVADNELYTLRDDSADDLAPWAAVTAAAAELKADDAAAVAAAAAFVVAVMASETDALWLIVGEVRRSNASDAARPASIAWPAKLVANSEALNAAVAEACVLYAAVSADKAVRLAVTNAVSAV